MALIDPTAPVELSGDDVLGHTCPLRSCPIRVDQEPPEVDSQREPHPRVRGATERP